MSTLASTHPTLLDLKSRMDSNGNIVPMIEMLSQKNEILEDSVWLESNELTGHTTSIRTGIPEPTFRKLYGGVQPSKSTSVKVREGMGMMENYAEVDRALADLNGNSAKWRMSEESAIVEGFGQKLARYMIYGNEATEPEGFTGLAPRFNDQSAVNGENIITSAATPDNTDNSSVWLVVWGPNTVHMIYPKGSQAGLQITDKGAVTIENVDGSNGRMEAYRTHYRQDAGMVVRDWRYVVRINFDLEDMVKDASTGPDLTDLMVQSLELVPSLGMGRPAFYMNRTVRTWLRRQMTNKTKNSTLSVDNMAGKMVLSFDGVPCRRVDQITSTEAGI